MDSDRDPELTCYQFMGQGHCPDVRVDFTDLTFVQTQSISFKWMVCLTSYFDIYHIVDFLLIYKCLVVENLFST